MINTSSNKISGALGPGAWGLGPGAWGQQLNKFYCLQVLVVTTTGD